MGEVDDTSRLPLLVARLACVSLLLLVAIFGFVAWLISRKPLITPRPGVMIPVFIGLGLAAIAVALAIQLIGPRFFAVPWAYCALTCVAAGTAFLACLEGFVGTVVTHSLWPFAGLALATVVVSVVLWPRRHVWDRWQERRRSHVPAAHAGS